MNGYIQHLHHRYKVFSQTSNSQAVVNRLDRLAEMRLSQAMEVALAHAMGEDETVYIFRRLDLSQMISLQSHTPDQHILHNWSNQLSSEIVRQIIENPDPANLIRFENEAIFISKYMVDLLDDRASERWYFFPLESIQGVSISETTLNLLDKYGAHFSAVLRQLRRQGVLRKLIDQLDERTLMRLWHHMAGVGEFPDPAGLRPVFRAALDLATILMESEELETSDHLFELYLESGAQGVSWHSKLDLAQAVLEAIRFLKAQGILGSFTASDQAALIDRLNSRAASFDWLDFAWLQREIVTFLAGSSQSDGFDLPIPHIAGKRNQTSLLQALWSTLPSGRLGLDRARPDSYGNRLILSTYLPGQSSSQEQIDLIMILLKGWKWIQHSPDRLGHLNQLRQKRAEQLVKGIPTAQQTVARKDLENLLTLGPTAVDILVRLVREEDFQPIQLNSVGTGWLIHSDIAGVWLLSRAIMDSRLSRLSVEADYPPFLDDQAPGRFESLLLLLGVGWANHRITPEDRFDPALCAIAGLPADQSVTTTLAEWSAIAHSDHLKFQTSVLSMLLGQRVFGGHEIALHLVDYHEAVGILLTDLSGQLGLLGTLIPNRNGLAVTASIESLLIRYQNEVGDLPKIWIAPEVAGLWPNRFSEAALLASSSQDLQRLQAAEAMILSSLAEFSTGSPLELFDLTLALAANALLRLWARWLRQFASSSASYLLSNFIRRPGDIRIYPEKIEVSLENRPLDIVLEMAGYFESIEQLSWLDQREVTFRLKD